MRWPCVMTTPPPIAQAISAVAPRAVSIGSAATVDVSLTGEGFAPTGEMRVRAEYYAADDLGDDTGEFAGEFAEEFAGRNATRGTTVTASFVSVSEVRRMKRPRVCAVSPHESNGALSRVRSSRVRGRCAARCRWRAPLRSSHSESRATASSGGRCTRPRSARARMARARPQRRRRRGMLSLCFTTAPRLSLCTAPRRRTPPCAPGT